LKKDIYHIASEYFKGTIGPEDRTDLLEWLEQSVENKLLFKELENVWKLTGSLSSKVEVDTDAEWNRFVQIRDKETNLSEDKTRRIIPLYLKIAAVIIPLLALASVLFYKTSQKPEWISYTTTNTTKQLILADGTQILLNKYSSFSYPEKFSKKERLVKLSGEAFFNVSKNGSSFIVQTDKANVKVLGTSFNLRVYKNESASELFVKEGKVLFSKASDPKINVITIRGEFAVLNDTGNTIEKSSNNNSMSWVEKHLVFANTPMSEVAVAIERYFHIEVSLPPQMQNCLFSGDFKEPQLNDMLDILCLTISCKYTMSGNTLSFSGNGCK
jgi:ferric-dicitrate binding protein FerR (iron transport regulator)